MVVPIKTRQLTHVIPEAVESSQMLFDNVEDHIVVFRTTKGWAVRVSREERCVTMFSSTRNHSNVSLYLAYQFLFV